MCHILNLDSTGGCNDKIKRCHIVNFELATIQQNYKFDAFYLTFSLKKNIYPIEICRRYFYNSCAVMK